MPPFAFVSPVIYVGAYDVTSDLNQISGSYNPNFLEVTTFGSSGWRQRIQGLIDVDFTASGFQDFSSTGIDSNTAPLVGATNVVTVGPNSTATAGDPAYLFQSLLVGKHQPVQLGEAAKFELPFKGQAQMAAGIISAPRASRTATASASAVQEGTSSTKVFGTRHIFSVSGNSPTLATFIESATNASMINPTTRLSFTTASTVGGEWQQAAAVGGGSYWRASWVIGGTGTPTFDFAVSLAIV